MVEVPLPEPKGGWPVLLGAAKVRDRAGMRLAALQAALRADGALCGKGPFGIVVVRRGWLVAEHYAANVGAGKRFDIWSCTKSLTSLAWGLVVDEGTVSLDTPIYDLIDDPQPLSDPRKAAITLGHVLSMTSGISGEDQGIVGLPTRPDHGAYEYVLGHAPNRFNQWVDQLTAAPGERWDYSDAAWAHLSLAYVAATGEEIAAAVERRLFAPMGVEAAWDRQGGAGFRGPHTNAHSGLAMSARDLARVGLLVLRDGMWGTRRLVSAGWLARTTHPSQTLNPAYGYGFWTNREGALGDELPRDLIMLAGHAENRCYILPSHDLVIARVATGSPGWIQTTLPRAVLEAIL